MTSLTLVALLVRTDLLECFRKLEPPLDAGSVHLEKGDTHDKDKNGSNETEDSFPQLFRLGPDVREFRVELIVSKKKPYARETPISRQSTVYSQLQ
jgi:hypothetical protein